MTGLAAAEVTEDRLLGGRVRLRQPAAGYRAAIDPVFLAAAVPAGRQSGSQSGGRGGAPMTVLDLGCGVGAAALCLLARLPEVKVTGLEVQPHLAALARDNAALNGWSERFRVVEGDLRDPGPLARGAPGEAGFDAGAGFDEVLCNPPHHPAEAPAAPDPAKAVATRESGAALDDWVAAALNQARRKGAVTFVHRADRLADLLAALRGRAGGTAVFPLWAKAGQPARRVLVRARKGLGAPLTLAAGLVLHEANGRFTPAADRVLRHGQGLAL